MRMAMLPEKEKAASAAKVKVEVKARPNGDMPLQDFTVVKATEKESKGTIPRAS